MEPSSVLLALAGGRETRLQLQEGGLAAMSWAWLGASPALALCPGLPICSGQEHPSGTGTCSP